MAKKQESLLQAPLAGAHDLASLAPTLGLQHVWFRIARARARGSLALVPVERDVSLLPLAQGVAQLAAEPPDARILLVNASMKGCPPGHGSGQGALIMDAVGASLDENVESKRDFIDFSRLCLEDAEQALILAPQLLDSLADAGKNYTATIFVVDSPLWQTRAIPLVRSLDAAIVCVSLGRSSFADTRRVVDIVGHELVLGAIALE